jgi:hypothetical protein
MGLRYRHSKLDLCAIVVQKEIEIEAGRSIDVFLSNFLVFTTLAVLAVGGSRLWKSLDTDIGCLLMNHRSQFSVKISIDPGYFVRLYERTSLFLAANVVSAQCSTSFKQPSQSKLL